jgi:preprotein translocase subunit YajC
MGNTILAATSTKSSSGGSSLLFLLVIIAIFGVMYFVMIRPQRNRQRRVMQAQRELRPGQQVRTTAGMYGTITSVSGDDVILEVAPGVEIRLMRRAVMDVISDSGGPGNGSAADGAAGAQDPVDGGHEAPGGQPEEAGQPADGYQPGEDFATTGQAPGGDPAPGAALGGNGATEAAGGTGTGQRAGRGPGRKRPSAR